MEEYVIIINDAFIVKLVQTKLKALIEVNQFLDSRVGDNLSINQALRFKQQLLTELEF